jgi:LacI family transcriptional regulator
MFKHLLNCFTMRLTEDQPTPQRGNLPAEPEANGENASALPTRSRRGDRVGRSVNLRDVAEAASVSVATVSMVLNNNPRISRATHARVQRVMEKMGYQPNRLAQSLSSKYTNVLAILLPNVRHAFADAYFGELLSGICDRTHKLGYKVMIEQAKPEFLESRKHLELFDRRFVDGVLCLGTNDNDKFLADFDSDAYPALIVDNCPTIAAGDRKARLDYVQCDYDSGATQALNYLIQLGHRKIGLITAAPEITTSRLVRDLYIQKLSSVGIMADDSLMVDGQFTEEGGAEAARQLLSKHRDVSAILAGNDKMAIGAMHQLHRLGVEVPRDISVVGFDDLKHAAFVNPSLTTVHLPLYQVGSLATDRLIERIHGRREPVAETISTHLVVRDSTAMAKTASRGTSESAD